ncbi:hypothetical protein QOT17_000123 [Balamuthia mandrillaris]
MYSFGGYNFSAYQATSSLYIYDPLTDSWRDGKEAPLAVSHCQGATDGERYLWIAGGFVGNSPGLATNQSWRYDALQNQWHRGPDLPVARASSAFVYDPVGGRLHMMGGLLVDRQTDLAEHLVLDVSEAASWGHIDWTLLPQPIPTKRNHFQAVYIRDSFYAIGGQQGHDGDMTDLDLVERYDLESERWEKEESIPAARSHVESGLVVANDRLIIPGGRENKKRHIDTTLEFAPFCGGATCWSYLRKVPLPMDATTAVFFRNITVPKEGQMISGDFMFVSSARTRRKIRPEQVIPDSWMCRVHLRDG